MPDTQRICKRRLNTFFIHGRVEFYEFDGRLTVWRSQHDKFVFNVLKPDDPFHKLTFQFCFPHHFKAKIKKKCFRGSKINDVDTHMIYSTDLHFYPPLLPQSILVSRHGLRSSASILKPEKQRLVFVYGSMVTITNKC